MRIARAIGVIGLSCWAALGCTTGADYAPQTYIVRPQDTLYSIAWRHDLDYHELARWNGIGADYRIAVGQVLTLRPSGRIETRPPPSAPSANETQARAPPRVSAPQPLAESPLPPADPPSAAIAWSWPTAHEVAPRAVPGGGILLLGELGQPIRAASSGRVVYVGNGIRGYGNLIIIKHQDNLLSAYAHTRELAVREGDEVRAGQVIAQMGTGPHQIAALYFEIRRNGKPVDPLPFLNEGSK